MSERPVSFKRLCAAMTAPRGTVSVWAPDRYVIVDEHGRALGAFDEFADADAELQRRFDEDHRVVEQLSLVSVRGGEEADRFWPRTDSPAQRARNLRGHLNWTDQHGLDSSALLRLARECWLRGRVIEPPDGPRVLELGWMTAAEPRVPVGVLVERDDGDWELSLAEDSLRPPAMHVYAALARTLACYLRDHKDWNAEVVQSIALLRHSDQRNVATFDFLLADFAIEVAHALDVLPRHLGGEAEDA